MMTLRGKATALFVLFGMNLAFFVVAGPLALLPALPSAVLAGHVLVRA